jgi:hypothetical protein
VNTFILSISAAVLSLSLVTVPMAQAAKNTGGYDRSSEGWYKHRQFCADLHDSYQTNMSYYKGNPAKRGRWKNTADDLKLIANENGCGWAQ